MSKSDEDEKTNRESAQTSIADIIDWESKRSTKGNTTVLYDSLPELTTEQIPNKPGQATREVNSQGASDDLALTSTQTLNIFSTPWLCFLLGKMKLLVLSGSALRRFLTGQ